MPMCQRSALSRPWRLARTSSGPVITALTLLVMTSGAEIALISGGWTAVVGLAGFGAAIYNNKAIKSTRVDRLYDKRAEAYVGYLAAIAWAQASRQAWLLQLSGREATAGMRRMLESFHEPEWHLLEARLQAFGTAEAFAAAQKLSTANIEASDAWTAWRTGPSEAGRTAAFDAIKAADDASDEFVEHVRNELIGKSAPLADWQPPGIGAVSTSTSQSEPQ